MRRTLALFVLLCAAFVWSGCSSSSPNQGAAPPDKATTTPASTTANTSNTNANKASGGSPTGIKPPMKDEK